jgi:hypothetical protein
MITKHCANIFCQPQPPGLRLTLHELKLSLTSRQPRSALFLATISTFATLQRIVMTARQGISQLFDHGLTKLRAAADNRNNRRKELEYLPLGASEIRLLSILPSVFEYDLKFSLDHYQCNSDLRCTKAYTALSYCWGDTGDTVAIKVNNSKLMITRSLEAAIRELKRRKYTHVWIDAICINQSDNDERGHQVLKMRDVYRNASQTVVWLGIENEHTQEAISICNVLGTGAPEDLFATRVMQLSGHDPEVLANLSGWGAVAAFFALPYWSRTWIIQEVAMSQTILPIWGSHVIALEIIQLAINTIGIHSVTIGPRWIGIDHILGLLGVRHTLSRGDNRGAGDLFNVLYYSCLSEATELQDKVFGVLGLAVSGISIGYPSSHKACHELSSLLDGNL